MSKLHVITAEPDGSKSVIERLEETLEKAKVGELSSVAIAVVYRDGCTSRCWSDAPSMATLIGSVGMMHHLMMRDTLEDA